MNLKNLYKQKTLASLVLLILFNHNIFSAVWDGFEDPVEYAYQNDSKQTEYSQPSTFIFKDFNNDGNVDFLIDGVTYGQSSMGDYIGKSQIFINNGNGTFQSPVVYNKGSVHRIVTDAADLNSDGNMDLLIPDFWANSIRLHYGQAGVTFVGGPTYGTGTHGGPSRFHDFDGDGDLDIISISAGSGVPLRIHFYVNNGGVFTRHATSYGYGHFDPGAFVFYKDLLLEDLNNDGRTDVFVPAHNGLTGGVILRQNATAFSFSQTNVTYSDTHESSYNFIDFNGDNLPDLYRSAKGRLLVHYNDGTGTFPFYPSLTIAKTDIGYSSQLVDLDNDGDLDVVTRSEMNMKDDKITTYLNDGANNFNIRHQYIYNEWVFTALDGYNTIDLHDVNADGYKDLLAVSRDNLVYVFMNRGLADLTAISPNYLNVYAGNNISYQIETEPTATSYSATNLPAWLSLNPTTGLLTGTAPTIVGDYVVTLSATDGSANTEFTLTIKVKSSLSEALDSDLQWYSSGGDWVNQIYITHDGEDAAEAPDIQNQTSLLYAEVEGPVYMTFWWKKWVSHSAQSVKLLIDGVVKVEQETHFWEKHGVTIPAGTHTVAFAFHQVSDEHRTAWVDEVRVGSVLITNELERITHVDNQFSYQIKVYPTNGAQSYLASGLPSGLAIDTTTGLISGTPTESGTFQVNLVAQPPTGNADIRTLELTVLPAIAPNLETENLPLAWDSQQELNWFEQNSNTYDGVDAMQSPEYPAGRYYWEYDHPPTLSGSLTISAPASLSFWRKTHTLTNNSLVFYINGVEQERHKGHINWTQSSYTLTPGTYQLAWEYQRTKNPEGTLEAVWIDQIELTYSYTNYATWISAYPAVINTDVNADHDADGIPNGIEYISGSNPTLADQGVTLSIAAHNQEAHIIWQQRRGGTGTRGVDYKWKDATISLDSTTNLLNGNWDAANATDITEVSVENQSNDTETVTVKLQPPLANESHLYFRLKAEIE